MSFLTVRREVFNLRRPWPVLGRGALKHRAVAYVESEDAVGEAAPALGSSETIEQALAWMRRNVATADLTDHASWAALLDSQAPAPRSAACAFEMAALDYQARRAGLPLWRFLQLIDPNGAVSPIVLTPMDNATYLSDLEAAELAPAILLRLGLAGPQQDIEAVRMARIKTDAVLRIDATGAWTPEVALEMIRSMAPLGVEYVEQPLAPGSLEATASLREQSPVAIILDEDVATVEDVERVAKACDGVRVSLMRAGGVTEALRAIVRARELGLLVVLGSDLESPVAATAAAHLAGLADYCDFSGHLYIDDPPYCGLRLEGCRLVLPGRPGIGVTRTPQG